VTFLRTVIIGTLRASSAKNEVDIMPTKSKLTGTQALAIFHDLQSKGRE